MAQPINPVLAQLLEGFARDLNEKLVNQQLSPNSLNIEEMVRGLLSGLHKPEVQPVKESQVKEDSDGAELLKHLAPLFLKSLNSSDGGIYDILDMILKALGINNKDMDPALKKLIISVLSALATYFLTRKQDKVKVKKAKCKCEGCSCNRPKEGQTQEPKPHVPRAAQSKEDASVAAPKSVPSKDVPIEVVNNSPSAPLPQGFTKLSDGSFLFYDGTNSYVINADMKWKTSTFDTLTIIGECMRSQINKDYICKKSEQTCTIESVQFSSDCSMLKIIPKFKDVYLVNISGQSTVNIPPQLSYSPFNLTDWLITSIKTDVLVNTLSTYATIGQRQYLVRTTPLCERVNKPIWKDGLAKTEYLMSVHELGDAIGTCTPIGRHKIDHYFLI